LSYGRKIRSN